MSRCAGGLLTQACLLSVRPRCSRSGCHRDRRSEQSEIPGAVAAGKIDRCTSRTVGDAERPAAAMVYVGQRLGRSRQQVGHVNHVAAAGNACR